jgi:hypothetical protein
LDDTFPAAAAGGLLNAFETEVLTTLRKGIVQWPCRLWLVAGAMVMPLSMSVCFTMQQTWQDFLSFYIRYGATYNSGGMLDVPPWRLLFLTSTQFTAYWVALMLSISGVVAWAKGKERWQSIPREKAVVCLAACAYCFVTACVTTWTRTGLTHYLLLMVCPLSLVAASIASLPDRTYQRRGRVWVPCILVVLGLQVAATGVEWQRQALDDAVVAGSRSSCGRGTHARAS